LPRSLPSRGLTPQLASVSRIKAPTPGGARPSAKEARPAGAGGEAAGTGRQTLSPPGTPRRSSPAKGGGKRIGGAGSVAIGGGAGGVAPRAGGFADGGPAPLGSGPSQRGLAGAKGGKGAGYHGKSPLGALESSRPLATPRPAARMASARVGGFARRAAVSRLTSPSSAARPVVDRGGPVRNVPCKFFAKGFCEMGENCRFRHPGAGKPVPPPRRAAREPPRARGSKGSKGGKDSRSKTVCIFWERGACKNGEKCRFLHGPAPDNGSVEPLSQEVAEQILQFLEEQGGQAEGGALADRFAGVKRAQLEALFEIVPAGNKGKFYVRAPGCKEELRWADEDNDLYEPEDPPEVDNELLAPAAEEGWGELENAEEGAGADDRPCEEEGEEIAAGFGEEGEEMEEGSLLENISAEDNLEDELAPEDHSTTINNLIQDLLKGSDVMQPEDGGEMPEGEVLQEEDVLPPEEEEGKRPSWADEEFEEEERWPAGELEEEPPPPEANIPETDEPPQEGEAGTFVQQFLHKGVAPSSSSRAIGNARQPIGARVLPGQRPAAADRRKGRGPPPSAARGAVGKGKKGSAVGLPPPRGGVAKGAGKPGGKASGKKGGSKGKLCAFFPKGLCRNGDQCPYVHDSTQREAGKR